MAKKNKNGKTWKEHSKPYLKRALQQASRSWKPKATRQKEERRIKTLQAQRDKVNKEIRKLKGKE